MPDRKPIVQAMLLADFVYMDRDSGKKVIAGTFSHLRAEAFPAVFPRTTWAFIAITEIYGEAEFTLQYRDLQTNAVLLECPPIKISGANPLAVIELGVEVPNLPMPHPGAYSFDLMREDEMFHSLRVTVSQLTQEPSP